MSTEKRLQARHRRFYRECYRWVRMSKQGVTSEFFVHSEDFTLDNLRTFNNALVSYDNAQRNFDGWINPYRSFRFWDKAFALDPEHYLPF